MSSAREKFNELKARTGKIADAELDEFWETLAPMTLDGMIGEWKGGEFDTGHRMNWQLEKARWFGKTFKSVNDVQPLVCLDVDGNKFSNVEMGRARPACGWKSSAARSPRRWSTTANPFTTTSRRSTTTR